MLFILLGALVDVDQLVGFAGRVAMLVAFLVLVVRSPSVAIALTGTSLSWRDRALIAWVSPRGIVAAATAAQFNAELSGAGFDADAIGPVTFAVILGTGVVHSLTPAHGPRAEGLQAPADRRRADGTCRVAVQPGTCVARARRSVVLITSRPSMDGRAAGERASRAPPRQRGRA